MSVLDSVLRYKEYKDAQDTQKANAIPQAINSFLQASQTAQTLQNQNLVTQLAAAKQGFRIENGQLVKDPSLISQEDLLNNQYKQAQIRSLNAKADSLNGQGQTLGNFDAKTPDEFLSSLPADKQQNIKDLIAGKVDPSRLSSLRNNERERLTAAASKYAELTGTPFDSTNYQVRYQTRKDFTTGKFGQALNSANTVLGHLDTLKEKLANLNNGQFPLANKIKNIAAGQAGQAQTAAIEPAIEAVASEMMRVYRSVGSGSEREIEAWKNSYDKNASPKQQEEFLKTGAELLSSKIMAMGDNWKNGMGTYAGFPGISARGQKTLKDLGVNLEGLQSSGDSSSSQIPDGATGTYKGQAVVRRGGKWVKA